ncbi:MAG: RHS repeat-associated core domain-containing protein [Enterobacterales bacterium]|nr:RHS repeat-associated core domain-containing protein [Enterobacterales bacterium]
MNRLTQRTFSPQSAPSIPSVFKATLDYVYDGFGNLKEKSDKGYYKYHSANVHELEGIYTNSNYTGEINTFVYDSSGNITDDGIRDFTYGSFDKPTYITKSSVNSSMKYGVNRELYFKEDNYSENGNSVNYKRTYLGTYEKVQRTGGAGNRIEHKYYVGNAVVTQSSNRTDTFYSYTDHQGSVVGTANQSGAHVSYAIYDPFGKRSEVYVNSLLSGGTFTEPTEKGYTGHIEMPEIGIIHMGGRIYDASIGRFLQADPIVQSPLDSQSYNRYAYVRNNPMTLTDPSGYSWFSKTWKKLRPYVGLIAMAIPGVREWAIASGSNAFLFGAAAGGVSTGSIRGAFTGGITGAIFHQIGSAFDAKTGWYAKDGFGHVFSHAMAGGVMSSLQGGKFGHGFFSAGVAKAANVNKIVGIHPDDAFLRVIVAASIGGTVSKLTGGKFANGAATAGFAQAFNGNNQAKKEFKSLQQYLKEKYGNLQISDEEREFAEAGDRESFWKSRLSKNDPVARTALAILYDKTTLGPYLKFGATANFVTGLEGEALNALGVDLMNAHIDAVDFDFNNNIGIPGLLSPTQATAYHHEVFEVHGLPTWRFGGTFLNISPNVTRAFWCAGCDYKGERIR